MPLLGSVLASNAAHIQRVVDTVLEAGRRRVALLGLSFKNGSDDLRESPFVTLAEALIGKGAALGIHDPDVALGQLVGRNRAYVEEHLPHVALLMTPNWEALVRQAAVVIVGKRVIDPARLAQVLRGEQTVVDLVGMPELGGAVRPWSAGQAALAQPRGAITRP
jgi:GDP-mannose 6-dehydrogenase